MEDSASRADDGLELSSCSICGRRFNFQSLKRHEPICLKASQKPRKVFDSSKQRIDGTDIGPSRSRKTGPPKKQTHYAPPKKSNWKEQHEEFISTIQAARGFQDALQSGKPLPPPPAPAANPDYVQCPHCQRRFNPNAAERHIPFCKSQHECLPKKKPDATAKSRMETRTQYKAPRLKGQGSGYGQGRTMSEMTATMFDHGAPSNYGRSTNDKALRISGSTTTANGRTHPHKTSADRGSADSRRGTRDSRTADLDLELRQTRQHQSKPTKVCSDGLNTYMTRLVSSVLRIIILLYTFLVSPVDYPDEGVRRNGRTNCDYREENYRSSSNGGMKRTSCSPGNNQSRFCHDCGSKFPVASAKFCCQCGVRRLGVS